ncbi:MAG: hypothetical protein KME64_12775 [Scytonematopsis contorta HA4267-MV1]|jgi:hypothetical protein|nr:hypothetical protein [Scytonematopsis contorta HA4267-MV1]
MHSRLLRTIDLSCQEKNAMFSLLGNHFKGVKRNVFESDLSNKNWVILLKDKNTKQLQGFSTLLMYKTQFQGENISVVYSGDTIVDPSAWSSSSLSRTWISSVNKLRTEYSQGKLYWLLISSGFRTYRFLPIFWKEFYPRYDIVTPNNISVLTKFLAQERFGEYYDENTGVVRFPYPHVLEKELLTIPPERMEDRHIEFFALQNPGYTKGEELVCITEITESNLTSAGKRMWFANSSSLNKNTPLPITNYQLPITN